jgi:hypothetical protein
MLQVLHFHHQTKRLGYCLLHQIHHVMNPRLKRQLLHYWAIQPSY